MLGVYPNLTKKYILERITQEDIMERYLGVKVEEDVLIKAPSLIRSKDENPTCSFYYNQHGRLRFRDFAGYFWGDCFDVVAKAISVDANDKRGFQMVLHTIAKDFRIHKYTDSKEIINYHKITSKHFERVKKKYKTIFKIIPRKFNYHDFGYWNKFNIDEKLLILGKVYAAQEIYISKNHQDFTCIYRYNPKDPAYCYFGGKEKVLNTLIDNWKIYYPFRKKGEIRFHSNSSFLQGKHLITCGRIGIITKAYKDVLSFRSFGLQAVAPSAESVLISEEEYFFMKSSFDYLISCMDYDRAGQRMAQLLRKTYGITPFMFTDGHYDSKNYGSKDFAAYVENNGVLTTKNLLTSTYNLYKEDIQKIDKYYKNCLNFIK